MHKRSCWKSSMSILHDNQQMRTTVKIYLLTRTSNLSTLKKKNIPTIHKNHSNQEKYNKKLKQGTLILRIQAICMVLIQSNICSCLLPLFLDLETIIQLQVASLVIVEELQTSKKKGQKVVVKVKTYVLLRSFIAAIILNLYTTTMAYPISLQHLYRKIKKSFSYGSLSRGNKEVVLLLYLLLQLIYEC